MTSAVREYVYSSTEVLLFHSARCVPKTAFGFFSSDVSVTEIAMSQSVLPGSDLILFGFLLHLTNVNYFEQRVQRDGAIGHFTVNAVYHNSARKIDMMTPDCYAAAQYNFNGFLPDGGMCDSFCAVQLHFLSHICNDFSIRARKP